MKHKIFIICFVIIAGSQSLSQKLGWHMTLTDGTVLQGVMLNELRQDSLNFSCDSMNQTIPVESITELRLVKESAVLDGITTGLAVGAAIGAVVGLFVGLEPDKPSSNSGIVTPIHTAASLAVSPVAGVVAMLLYAAGIGSLGCLIGGVFGAATSMDDVYDLSQLPHRGKINTVNWILKTKLK